MAELVGRDPWSEGEPRPGTLFLVCTHGRRDACCSRLGIPIFHGLDAVAGKEHVWQCSHTGGHRFAPNVIVLPWGVTLGRVEREEVPEIVGLLADGRVPLARYRGRSLYPPPGQAAEVAIRRARELDRLDALRLVSGDGGRDVGVHDGRRLDGGCARDRVGGAVAAEELWRGAGVDGRLSRGAVGGATQAVSGWLVS